jgi:hypothetical protein
MIAGKENRVAKATAAALFDPALRSIELHMYLGGRVANPSAIADKVLTTLDLLETLDTRPMEWLHVNYSEQRMGSDNKLPRTHPQMELSVEDGARKDDAGQFYASWGYSVSILGFLAGGDRRVTPFDLVVVDGDQDPRSGNSFRLSFDDALVPDRDSIVESFASLVKIWGPTRGAIDGLELAKRHRNDRVLYPPIGVITYFAENTSYTLPASPVVDLHPLNGGTLAILKDWTLESVLAYEELFRALNEGIPNPRFSR